MVIRVVSVAGASVCRTSALFVAAVTFVDAHPISRYVAHADSTSQNQKSHDRDANMASEKSRFIS